MSDVWRLETEKQLLANESLETIVEKALKHDKKCQNYVKDLWDESWPFIEEKLTTEGSVWYVWWIDGLNQHIENMEK